MAILKPKQVAQKLNVTVKTLQKWDASGKLPAHRSPTNRRYYESEEIDAILGKDDPQRKTVAYARVSSRGQKDDLQDQVAFLRQFINAKGIILDEMISEVGSGLNYKRKKWNKLLKEVDQNQIGTIYVTYKDRFVRFGFDWFEKFCSWHDVKIVVLNNKDTSPNEELVQDIIAILHVFSCRLYGLRRYKDQIQKDKQLQKKN